MITKITGQTPFQVLTNNFSISPSNEGYTLQISADGVNFSNLFSVGANVTRLVTGVAANSYYRLLGNESAVQINWMKTCVTEGGGGGGVTYSAGTYIDITEDVISVTGITPDLYLTSANTQNFVTNDTLTAYTPTTGFSTVNGSAITNGGNLVIQGGGGGSESVVELTQEEYDALTAYSENTTYIITDADPINLDIYATSADTASISGAVDTLSGVVETKAAKVSVTANNARQFPKWNTEGIVTGTTGSTAYEQNLNINGTQKTMLQTTNSSFGTIYAPTAAGTQNQILQSNGSGAPVWSNYKFVFISQTDYDAITTKDATTIYFITGD